MKRQMLVWLVVAVLCGLLVACAESAPSSAAIAAQPPAITSTALRPTVEAAQVDQYLQAIQAQATLDTVHAQQTATAIAQSATATAQAWEYAATEQALRATATAQAWQATATAQAQIVQATATAEAIHATATAQAWQATATVETFQSQQQATATAAAWEVQATSTAVAARAIATAQAAEAEKAELEATRARITYPVRAYGPWVMLFAAVALLLWGGYRLIRVEAIRRQTIPRDARGDAPIVIVERNGKLVALDVDRNFGPATIVDAQGQVAQPALAPPEQQARVTTLDQLVDMAHRGLPGGSGERKRKPTPAQTMRVLERQLPPRPGVVQIVQPAQVRTWLREVQPQALQDVIEGEVTEVLNEH